VILGYKTSLSTVDAKQTESHSPLTLEYGAGAPVLGHGPSRKKWLYIQLQMQKHIVPLDLENVTAMKASNISLLAKLLIGL